MQYLINNTRLHIKGKFTGESSGHDYEHINRVAMLARKIAVSEGADPDISELAGLVHDIADWKFHHGDDTVGPREAHALLRGLDADQAVIDHVVDIVANNSFKGAGVSNTVKTLEGKCVQDADRLDAIGAIGIARCFAYGGHAGRVLYDPETPVVLHQTAEAYKANKSASLNHFFEKLFLIKDRMNTETGKAMAFSRHAHMEVFVEQFLSEWNLKDI